MISSTQNASAVREAVRDGERRRFDRSSISARVASLSRAPSGPARSAAVYAALEGKRAPARREPRMTQRQPVGLLPRRARHAEALRTMMAHQGTRLSLLVATTRKARRLVP